MSNLSGVVREGWLKRVKNQKKRYFVLGFNKETGDAQLQYYENPKKFTAETIPKRVISLQQCLGIIKKCDDRFGNILVLYTKEAVFRLKADSDELLEGWLTDLDKLHQMEYKNLQELQYEIVWNVKVVPRGLGGLKNVTGSYKLCLKDNTLYFINPVTQDIVIEEKLYHVRKFGYLEYNVFMEFGRSTALGPGEIWMEVEDPLIAQKIEDSLSRSVKPKTSRPKSVADSVSLSVNGELPFDNINNNNSPRPRRSTLFDKITPKKKIKDDARRHANSVSGSPAGSAEEKIGFGVNGNLPRNPVLCEEEECEEAKHYPMITPPVPSLGRPQATDKNPNEKDRAESNEYANIQRTKIPRPRSKSRKLKLEDVREDFAKEYAPSLPQRTSSSSSSEPSWRHSMGSEVTSRNDDSDSTRESDREDNALSPEIPNQYIIMKCRPTIGSESSTDEQDGAEFGVSDPASYIVLKPPSPDTYVQMSPNLEKSRNTSVGSIDSNYSGKGGGEDLNAKITPYVNMVPRGAKSRVTSSSSSEELPTAEQFDHLDRDNSSLSSYVNMSPGIRSGVELKKSQSQIYHASDSKDYVNVDMSRSRSVGSKRFQIVSEPMQDGNEHAPSSYINVKGNGAGGDEANYANFIPQNQKDSRENSPKKELHYASVDFSRCSPPQEKGSPRRGKNREESNYSKIDFEKSNVLADISSTRERQLHHA